MLDMGFEDELKNIFSYFKVGFTHLFVPPSYESRVGIKKCSKR